MILVTASLLAAAALAATRTNAGRGSVSRGAASTKTRDQQIGERLDFVERNIMNVLRHGTFPELYNSTYKMIKNCGCLYSPAKINYGSKIGLQCQRHWMENGAAPPYDTANCGPICSSPLGADQVLWCPHGWDQDCSRGCFPVEEFDTVRDRVDFWELALSQILIHGHDYVNTATGYLESCGCEEGKMRTITYGSKIGFECVLKKGVKPQEPCQASSICLNDAKRPLVTFCPAGHRPTCEGCEKVVKGDPQNSLDRVNWMIMVVTGYARESMPRLGWEPSSNQMMECSCKGSVQPITYGLGLGFYCEIGDPKDITIGCGPNRICENHSGKNILHFCPDGFHPSCSEGCTYPWDDKVEL